MSRSLKGSLWPGTNNSITGQVVLGVVMGNSCKGLPIEEIKIFFLGFSLSAQCCGFSLSALWGDGT